MNSFLWFIIEVGGGTFAWEGERVFHYVFLSFFQGRRVKKRPFEQRELIFTVSEIARTLGVSETHLQWIPEAKFLIAIGGRLDTPYTSIVISSQRPHKTPRVTPEYAIKPALEEIPEWTRMIPLTRQ